ncbi:MAG: winged helix-turn-helix domain-containing protein [Nautiliaceae bacterium]
MRVLNFSFLDIPNAKKVDEESFFDEVLNKKFDVLVVDFNYFKEYLEIKDFVKSTIIFLAYECNVFIYKKALEVGDYCYSYNEYEKLLIRLRYLKKKVLNSTNFVFKFGDLLYNFNARELYKSSIPVKLSGAEKELLETLIKNRNRYLSKEEILQECESIESLDSIKVLISHLRKLGFEIVNQKNLGYKLKEIK